MTADPVYVVTDIECDGPWVGPSSMLSLASVAVTATGERHGEFEAVLQTLPGSQPDPGTLAWFRSQPPAVWAAATTDPREPVEVMRDYVAWVQALPRPRVFTASPLGFDGGWIDFYLRRCTRYALVQSPYDHDPLFDDAGLCLRSYAAAVTGRPVTECGVSTLPPEWLGDVAHTHRAIDDARGYANLLVTLMGMAAPHTG